MNSETNYYRHQVDVAFKDTDMAGVVHFTQLLAYVEEAEHKALDSLGIKPISTEGGFPKVHVSCDYTSPARFGEQLFVYVGISKIGEASLTWSFKICQKESEKIVARGSLVTVLVGNAGDTQVIQPDVLAKLSSFQIN